MTAPRATASIGTDYDTVVLGGGVMGSAAAWQLAGRGRQVTLFERFSPGHAFGASHGARRNFNTSYSDAPYVDLVVEARRWWDELSSDSGVPLLEQVGLVRHGPDPESPAIIDALTAVGEQARMMPIDEASERWPQIRFDREVLWCETAGRVRADDGVRAMQTVAAARGAEILHGQRILALRVQGDDLVELDVEDASGIRTPTARRIVVTAGAWTSKLLAGVIPLPPLRVTQEQPAHFPPTGPEAEWPTFMHTRTLGDPLHDYFLSGIYGMLTPGEGVKVGWHGTGPVVDPDHRSFQPDPAQLAALSRYAREWLPGVDADSPDPISCTYTSTRSEDFLLDRVGPVVFGAGFSGHGFKFAPAVGRILADLAETGSPAPEEFRLPLRSRRMALSG